MPCGPAAVIRTTLASLVASSSDAGKGWSHRWDDGVAVGPCELPEPQAVMPATSTAAQSNLLRIRQL
jgi:hypothetical protein